MEVFLNIMTCIFEVTIFELFFKGLLRRRYSSPIFYIAIYIGVVSLIYGINSLGNSKLNLIANILIYYAVYSLLYEEELKERVFYFTVFFTTFAGVEILFEFVLSLILGEGYSWENQSHLARFIVICLEKLITFVTLFIIKKKLNKQKYGIKNEILLYSLVLPIATFGIYSALLYSGLMVEVSGINEGILLVGCILLLFANAIIFFLYEYIFRLNYENQALEMLTLKTDLEKKYYDRMEKINLEQSNYMHDLKFMLRTIGNLAVQDQNEEITSVIQNMKIRIGAMEEEFFCKNKVLNTILCEKKKEAIDNKINYQACNLIESFTAFVDFVEELSHAGEETAKKQCHCSGWTANHNVDIWRQTGPVDGEPKYAYWPMGGVWLCSQSYEYYRYSRDLEYLKNKIYPSLRGSVLFCLDWLQQREDGLYYTAPSTSPENTFKDGEGHACGVSYMTTMDLAIIKELFANYLEACNALEIKEDLIEQVNERSKLLPNYQIGRTGKIQEWIKDFEEFDVGHRHFSPVFGFHPGHSIKKTDTELVKACQKFIEEKVANYKQQIGWSCAWLINLWARLGDGTKANYYYEELLRQSVYNNLFDLHPPLGETEGEREVFQIDGNFGSASAVAEMLLSSEDGKITILPALPESWESGKVKGLLAVGGVEVDIAWKNKKPISISLCSSVDQSINIFYGNKKLTEKIELKKQEQQIIDLHSCEWI